jgi:hypothetical protein
MTRNPSEPFSSLEEKGRDEVPEVNPTKIGAGK